MKRIIYIILLCVSSLALTRCSDGIEDVFDKSPGERTEMALEEIRETLVASPSGWLLDYYLPDASSAVSFLFKFHADGNADVSRIVILRENPEDEGTAVYDQVETSSYEVIPSAGPVISFNTYNRLLHHYADPGNTGVGFRGDFEFIVLKTTPDRITIRGKKHGVLMTMWRMEEGREWKDYLAATDDMMTIVSQKIQSEWRKKVLTFGGKSEILPFNALRGLRFPEEMSSAEGYIDYAVTDKGIRLLTPIEYEGKEVYDFVVNADHTEFKAPNVDMKITKGNLALNEQLHFNAQWGISGADMCDLYKDDWIGAAQASTALAIVLSTRRNSDTEPVLAIFYLQQIFLVPGFFYYDFIPVEGTTDQVTLRYLNRYDANAGYLFNYSPDPLAVRKIFPIIGGIGNEAVTFRLSVMEGTQEQPTQMKFTNIKNADHYFTGHYMKMSSPY